MQSCVIGSKAVIATESTENDPSMPVGEWMSGVLKSSNFTSSTACLILDLQVEEFAKRMSAELIYEDVSHTVQKVSLFEYDIVKTDIFAKERFGTFEFHLNNVLTYQVCKRQRKMTCFKLVGRLARMNLCVLLSFYFTRVIEILCRSDRQLRVEIAMFWGFAGGE